MQHDVVEHKVYVDENGTSYVEFVGDESEVEVGGNMRYSQRLYASTEEASEIFSQLSGEQQRELLARIHKRVFSALDDYAAATAALDHAAMGDLVQYDPNSAIP